MIEEAYLLTGDHPSIDDSRAGRLLEFFGVSYETRKATEFCRHDNAKGLGVGKCRLVCSAENFARVFEERQGAWASSEGFAQRVHSVFLYPTGNAASLSELVSGLCGTEISVRKGAATDTDWCIADDPEGLCGSMRGLRIRPTPAALERCDVFNANGSSATPIISAANKIAFLKLTWETVPVFVSSERLIDIDAELTTPNFDVRDHFFSAVPAVSYLKWACPGSSWTAPEASACLVIDDPLLKARYGFVRFRELLALMKQHRFSTSIAFIPWNWRRSDRKVVQLFKENPEKYSLCIHGCDHTAGEFGISDRQRLRSIASEAIQRMSRHEKRTGLAHDRVMVFPQGVFSEEAIHELKRSGFNEVVNTEVHSNPPPERKIKISDVWDVAVMAYGDFPLYTRRYPAQGVENLAFDVLLGKPCLVVIHHDFCSDGCARLVGFIDRLNGLKVPLTWRRLGDLVRRSYRQRSLSPDSVEIEMYGNELLIENRSERAKTYSIRRREHDADSIERIDAGSRQVSWHSAGEFVEFKVHLDSGETTLLVLRFKPAEGAARSSQNVTYAVKTMLRRYLSEARDNYLAPAKARMIAFSRS
jgi:hypothetical protein